MFLGILNLKANSKVKLFLCSMMLWVLPVGLYAQTQTCEIKHGLEKISSGKYPSYRASIFDELSDRTCYQIGNEFNSGGNSLEDKPIFACCKTDPT